MMGLLGLPLMLAVPGLSTADIAPQPTAVPALSAGDAALVGQVNSLYYNYKTLGLHKFKCEVKVSMFDSILKMFQSQMKPDDKRITALKDVRFFISYDEKTGYNFNYTNYVPTGDAATDDRMARILQSVSQIVSGFWTSWESVSFEPAIDTVKNTITVKKTATGYEIDEKNGAIQSANILDPNLVITEADLTNTTKPGASATVKPVFAKTTDGLLMNSVATNISESMNTTLDITYETIQKFQMPSEANFAMNQLGSMKMNVSIQFLNYQVN
jgi:hypothetical protein